MLPTILMPAITYYAADAYAAMSDLALTDRLSFVMGWYVFFFFFHVDFV